MRGSPCRGRSSSSSPATAFAAAAWERALARAVALGWELVEIDYEPFAEVARMLYDGPWIAERFASVGRFVTDHRRDVDPIVRRVILRGRDYSAVDAFRARHRLAELRRVTAEVWGAAGADALLLPTAPTLFTAAEIADEPIVRNALLGTYTNFVNLLDLCAVAVPGGAREDGLPFGVQLIAPAGADRALLTLAARWLGEASERTRQPPRIASSSPSSAPTSPASRSTTSSPGSARASSRRSAPRRATACTPCRTPSPRSPASSAAGRRTGRASSSRSGSCRSRGSARSWPACRRRCASARSCSRTAAQVKGFLCEADAVAGALDITSYGGWRAYRASLGLAGPAPVS